MRLVPTHTEARGRSGRSGSPGVAKPWSSRTRKRPTGPANAPTPGSAEGSSRRLRDARTARGRPRFRRAARAGLFVRRSRAPPLSRFRASQRREAGRTELGARIPEQLASPVEPSPCAGMARPCLAAEASRPGVWRPHSLAPVRDPLTLEWPGGRMTTPSMPPTLSRGRRGTVDAGSSAGDPRGPAFCCTCGADTPGPPALATVRATLDAMRKEPRSPRQAARSALDPRARAQFAAWGREGRKGNEKKRSGAERKGRDAERARHPRAADPAEGSPS